MIIGNLSALGGSCCWAACSTLFAASVRRLGVYSLNLVRLWLALFFLAVTFWIWNGSLIPAEVPARDWFFLALSALVGLVVGDLLYFGALKSVGPRITLLLFSLSPPVAAAGEWLVYGNGLGPAALIGMGITLAGVAMVITEGREESARTPFSLSWTGIWLGVGAAFCQGAGLVLSKMGLTETDPLGGTFIRMLTAAPLFTVAYLAMGGSIRTMLRERKGLSLAAWGAFFGPYLGVTLSLVAVKHTHAGIAMTILSTTPITVLPFSVLVYKERLTPRAVAGAAVAVGGVALLFL